MPRTCTICGHAERHEIEVALVNRTASYRDIAGRFGTSKTAVSRHVNEGHIAERLTKAHEAAVVANADELLARVQGMVDRMETWLALAERSYDYREVRAFAGEWRQQVELLARLAGQIDERPVINIHLHPEWIEIRTAVVLALRAHPDARDSFLRAVESVENGHARN